MSVDWPLQVLAGLAISIATSLVTVRLSLKQFRSEKWWERKVAAYTEIIEALENVLFYEHRLLEDFLGIASLPTDDAGVRLRAKVSESHEAIKKASRIGAFFISTQANNELKEMEQKIDRLPHEESWSSWLETRIPIYQSTLEKVRLIAKKDLNVQ